ncbi:MAG: hypothetical protein EBZ83_06025 [Verrucomicrobia bacterium]|nr:hypothetical protein [Verrucomicrobiota bacterium]
MGRVHGRTPVADGRLALSPEQNRIRKAAESLAERLGLSGPEQLAGYLPRRHEDRQGGWHPSQGLPEGPVNFQGTVTRSKLNRWRGRRCMVEVDVEVAGNMGGLVRLVFYNLPFMARAFPEGKRVAVFGRAEEKKGVFVFAHPETETVEEGKEEGIHLDRVVPVYPLTEGVSQRRVRSVLYHYLKEFWPTLEEVFPGLAGIPTRSQAWKTLHFPGSLREVEIARRSLAHEELLGMQFTLRVRRAAREAIRVERPGKTRDLVEPWVSTSRSGRSPLARNAALCLTPNLCCSSITQRERRDNRVFSAKSAWVPTVIRGNRPTGPGLLSEVHVTTSSTPRGSSLRNEAACCSTKRVVGAISAT